MDWQEIKNKGEKELRELLADQRAELQSLNFQAHNRQLKQVHKIQLVKKTIARISMLLTNLKRASSK
jgi:ribosomal protein L29